MSSLTLHNKYHITEETLSLYEATLEHYILGGELSDKEKGSMLYRDLVHYFPADSPYYPNEKIRIPFYVKCRNQIYILRVIVLFGMLHLEQGKEYCQGEYPSCSFRPPFSTQDAPECA